MKSARLPIIYILALLCCAMTYPTPGDTYATDGVGDKKKNKGEKIKELIGDSNPFIFDDINFSHAAKIKIYNKNDVLVYEDDVASINDISHENLRKCFVKGEFIMKHNNISYYIINS